ncbi:hypothetical protein BDV27DRAFT_122090 [Aspergillus caelatus]|uniref:Uncharacterized protein n=1 Tax=Aspergillus caelatus TaxID=61420 RepID=A0A5N7AFP1_9EURO|nr:uncharacterized protein BDV27DRAFT_122090 [Aspergillus caelatus]KAE8368642.1 hypothetical protein BDV27DRAFT_122090 [Aspergillus caelatus]
MSYRSPHLIIYLPFTYISFYIPAHLYCKSSRTVYRRTIDRLHHQLLYDSIH